ncbi:MAG: DUF2809 domain-containing protein [Labilithrix sp.]|nr:DUF2809 domain-containing protein [Labilithrix sp.]MCW5814248.1 DUF2809 domain-containing protein [Labilithrix sp.]
MRRFAIAGAALSIGLGLLSRRAPIGLALWDKSFGDAIYAVMIGFLVLAARPGLGPRAVGLAAFAICFALEVFQLTGVAGKLPRFFRFVLGTTFAWHDVACYVAGALAVTALCALESRRRRRA